MLFRLMRFVIAGTIAAVVNLLLLSLLVERAGLHYLPASVLSFLGSLGVSFTLQKFWTFRSHALAGTRRQFVRYSGITLLNLCINTGLMYVFVSVLGLWYIAAQIFAGVAIAITGYLGYHVLVFSRPPEGSSPRAE